MTAPSARHRYRSLDGLRGLAALVVVIHHIFLTSPTLAADPPAGESLSGLAAWLTYTPLHLLWAGTEAVFVFFVLSGFVLTAPYADGHRPFQWRSYYPRRLARLYIPVAVSLAIAVPQARWLRPDVADPTASGWMNTHIGGGSLYVAARDALLVFGNDPINSPLWSLQWEVLFSLLLPAYLLLRRVTSAPVALAAAGAISVLAGAGAAAGWPWLHFMPMFALGCLAVCFRHRLASLNAPVVLVVGLLLLTVPGLLRPWAAVSSWGSLTSNAIGAAAAAAVVCGFLRGPVGDWAARDPRVQWLGLRSFALYLVHEPLVVTLTFMMGGRPPLLLTLLVVLPITLLAAEVFGRWVEEPSHRFSRRLGGVPPVDPVPPPAGPRPVDGQARPQRRG